jgi:hypothetical protein
MKIQLSKTVKCKTLIEESKPIVERIIELTKLLNQVKSDMLSPSGRLKKGVKQRICDLNSQISSHHNLLHSKADEVEEEIYEQMLYKIQKHIDEVTAKFMDVHHDLAVAIRTSLFRHLEQKMSENEYPACYDFPKVTIENKDYYVNAHFSDTGDGGDGIVITIHDSNGGFRTFTVQKESSTRHENRVEHRYFIHLCKFDLNEFTIECPEAYSELRDYGLRSSSFETDNATSLGILLHALGKMMEIMNKDLKLNSYIGMERHMTSQIRRPQSLRAIENQITENSK